MIPTYATTLAGKTPEQLAAEIAAPPPVIEVGLDELQAFQWKCRGVYESTWPDLAGDLTLRMGQKFTTWLDREPDWTSSSKGRRQPYVMLYELLPLSPPGKPERLMIYRWKLLVKGEAERRAVVEQASVFHRMENA